MINFSDLDGYLYDWMYNFTNYKIVWARGNGVKADLPFVQLYRQSLNTIGHDYIMGFLNDDEDRFNLVYSSKELILNVQSFGSNSFGILDNIKSLASNPGAQDDLLVHGISFVDSTTINNITALVDARYEERASMDCTFRFTIAYGEDESIETGFIDRVEIQGKYEYADETRNSLIIIERYEE